MGRTLNPTMSTILDVVELVPDIKVKKCRCNKLFLSKSGKRDRCFICSFNSLVKHGSK